MVAKLHPQLGKGSPPYNGHVRKDLRFNQAGGKDQSRARRRTKILNVAAPGPMAASHLRRGLPHVAAPSLIPVPYGFLRTAQNVINFLRSHTFRLIKKMPQGQAGGSLAS